MNDNQLELISGRLGIDPKLSYTKTGNPLCEMSLGMSNEQNKTIWRKIVVFGRLAELCSVHLRKGNEIFVRGRKELKSFKDKNGFEREYFEVMANSIGQSLI